MNDVNYKYESIYKNKKVLVITSHKETTLQQLKENISSIHVELSAETLNKIDKIQELQPNPGP